MTGWVKRFFPAHWYTEVSVERGKGGLDRWGNPLPTETFEVDGCLLDTSPSAGIDVFGEWSDSDALLTHDSFVFKKNDVVIVPAGERNAGEWEVQNPSSEGVFGTATRVRRVNQDDE